MFLHEQLKVLRDFGSYNKMPSFIKEGLNERFEIRDYQVEAFENFITYYENDNLSKNKQIHLLFHMATGSGKTLIMAGLILYLYKKGYRNFLFFVNLKNIIEKTKDNFLKSKSTKYLFSQNIILDGEQIKIKEVNNFQHTEQNMINICFTTTQKLHIDLNVPKENFITINDFQDNKVVLISDESHHINSITKSKKTKEEIEEENSWEYSVNRVFRSNKDSILLEFTATCDLQNRYVSEKYTDKIIFDYPLKKFRESKFTKDFDNFVSNTDLFDMTLQAMLLSQYRLKLFSKYKQNIKPVILVKSKLIKESEKFYEEFYSRLETIFSVQDIQKFENSGDETMQNMFSFYKANNITYEMLVQELKTAFSREHSIIMNGQQDITDEKQKIVNSLEDEDNKYRILFVCDMLNEGWDVLNLFDIVRLYETRQSGYGKISPYTIQEAQLIGRGARYCPFEAEGENKYKRKYDDDLNNEMRICEKLLYHSKHDSRYIAEIRAALEETGLIAKEQREIEYKIKDSFKIDEIYKTGYVFENKQILISRGEVEGLPERLRTKIYNVIVTSTQSRTIALFDDAPIKDIEYKKHNVKFNDIPLHITVKAMHQFGALKFNYLKEHFPNLKSTRQFIQDNNYLAQIQIYIKSENEELKPKDYYFACFEVLKDINEEIGKIEAEYRGTEEFYAKRLREIIRDKKRQIMNLESDGEGISQNAPNVNNRYRMDLTNYDWYIYNDNFGTTEEKKFVRYFAGIVDELNKKYEKVYLIRNERQLKLFSFETGQRFEPDYLLLLQKDKSEGFLYKHIFIEPKGEHLLFKDKWKEEFLLEIENTAIPTIKYKDSNDYDLIGLPFYNEAQKMKEFNEATEKLIKN